MTVIDLSPQLDEIRFRYPEYWLSGEAHAELAALWGGVQCNAHGVLDPAENIRIDLNDWWAEIHIAHAPNGWYAVSTSHWYGMGGGGSSPSVWNRTAYTTREEAVDAGIRELTRRFEGVRDWKGTAPQNQALLAQRMIDRLKREIAQARQLSLF